MMYYAHSSKNGIPAQLYQSHINGVRDRVCEYADILRQYARYDGELLAQTAEVAAVFHDLGKLDIENQAVLSGKTVSKSLPNNHVDAGVAYLLDKKHSFKFAAVAVQAHHHGFPDFPDEVRKEYAFRDSSMMGKTDKMLTELVRIHNSLIETVEVVRDQRIKGDHSVFFRLILSCLVDADHTDTAVNYGKYPAKWNTIPLRPIERLVQLDNYVANLKENGFENKRNALRNEMYSVCRDKKIDANIASCDSPVGSGKTTAIMAHLLKQAAERRLRRIFIVLPYTNIITQSVDIYRDALVLPGEKAEDVVAELHHRADFENEDVRHFTALWKAPIIVTTAVAFFETLASNSTATLRRLHELPGSAIFVDESHAALPVKLLPLAWKWMNVYGDEWGCYWVLASGSLNRFWTIKEIAGDIGKTRIVPEIVSDDLRARLSDYETKRITYKSDLRPMDEKELMQWVNEFKGPRLVIVNTVQSAAVLASYFAEQIGQERVEHLSTALTPDDRRITLERVKKRLESNKDTDWTLIATSCVEAGVNFSFRTGFREICSLVSLLQASGRVNREGRDRCSEMWTFRLAESSILRNNPAMNESAEVLRKYLEDNMAITPELSTRSIADEIKLNSVLSKFKKLIDDESVLCFRQVEGGFKVIDTNTRTVVVDKKLAENISLGTADWIELQRKSVQVAKYKLDELKTPMIAEDIYEWNLDYNDFIGYMAGIIRLKKFEGQPMII